MFVTDNFLLTSDLSCCRSVSSLGIHDAPEESDECFMEGVHLDPVRASFQKVGAISIRCRIGIL